MAGKHLIATGFKTKDQRPEWPTYGHWLPRKPAAFCSHCCPSQFRVSSDSFGSNDDIVLTLDWKASQI
jgi:hypothetical protein